MPLFQVRGGRIAYDDAGRGPAVVFCHAGIADRRMWEAQFRALSADHRVLRYDWRGVGESDAPTDSVCHYKDLLALLDGLAVDDPVVVGSSMGGAYAIDAALAAPARVRGLVLVSSGLSGHVWPDAMTAYTRPVIQAAVPAARLERYRAGAGKVLPADVAAMAEAQARLLVAGPRRSASDIDPATWSSAVGMLRDLFMREWSTGPFTEEQLDPPAASRLSDVRQPTVVVNGTEDLPWIQELADQLSSSIAGAVRVDLEHTAHLSPVERPAEVTHAIQELL
jgi:pimeloyl-ACP methyl ester carboxylesterase